MRRRSNGRDNRATREARGDAGREDGYGFNIEDTNNKTIIHIYNIYNIIIVQHRNYTPLYPRTSD